MKKCPFCSEEIQDEANKCRFCREWINKKENFNNKVNEENNIIKVESKKQNKYKRWFFFFLILLTIYIPQIVAMNFNTEFSFGYPVGEEYGFAKAIGGVVAAFLIFNFLKSFQIKKTLAIIISVLSMIPAIRLITTVGIFFYFKRMDEISREKICRKDSVKDIAMLLLGYLAIHLILTAFSGLYFAPDKMDLYRLLLSIIIIYFVSRRKLIFSQKNFALYVIASAALSFLIMI